MKRVMPSVQWVFRLLLAPSTVQRPYRDTIRARKMMDPCTIVTTPAICDGIPVAPH